MHTKNIFNFTNLNLNNFNRLYIENIYQKFLKKPNSLPSCWKNFFNKKIKSNTIDTSKHYENNTNLQEFKLINLIRTYGHKYANTNPLNTKNKYSKLLLFLKLNNICNIYNQKKLYKIYKKFTKIYCTYIGAEYMYINNFKEKKWIKKNFENNFKKFQLSDFKKINLLHSMVKSETIEKYLNTKFPGSKRFSLEGCEVLIPVLNNIIYQASKNFSSKIIIGMSHRGRLNVLINVLNKSISNICEEFSDKYYHPYITGDAKYHAGITTKIKLKNTNIIVDLKPNPSHLEIINPVVMGCARANIENNKLFNSNTILPINIHGDSAIIGQGINQETLNMSQTKNYTVGGTIHIIINNQIGFTTSKKINTRSSKYCTDIAKMIDSPIFHVNSDNPESLIFIVELAMKYRYKFKKDIFIDIVCYRRNGHNESDDPSVTQPIMYKKIKNHASVCQIYSNILISKSIINKNYINILKKKIRTQINILNKEKPINHHKLINKKIKNFKIPNLQKIQKLGIQIYSIPKNIILHNRVLKIYQERYTAIFNKTLIDWGTAENLAYANILYNGISCRISGQDVGRGTFFHRHAIICDQNSGKNYIPLKYINKNTNIQICNSVLSEEAVLAFEYGYSINTNKTINIWEAQFGDFCNGAQIVIDQFISSGEQKWGIQSKLIMLLPHGYEGQGPEHSSSRLERFLQLCAQKNMKICIPSNTSQIYHLLCNQAFSNIKKPLIIFTPKSLLRNPMANSLFEDIQNNKFQKIIYKIDPIYINKTNKIIFCSGKIYYELLKEKIKTKKNTINLIRIEQLYPFPKQSILKLLNKYNEIKNITWCQEEPKNQGAWNYIYMKLIKIIPNNISIQYIGRPSISAPAEGYFFTHNQQQKKIISDALNTN